MSSTEDINFEVVNKRFWVLEKKGQAKDQGETWVFNNEKTAVVKLRDMLSEEEIDFDNQETMNNIDKRYNLQEIEIANESFQVKPVPWFKVALLGFTKK